MNQLKRLIRLIVSRQGLTNLCMLGAITLIGFGASWFSFGAGLLAAGIGLGIYAYLLGAE